MYYTHSTSSVSLLTLAFPLGLLPFLPPFWLSAHFFLLPRPEIGGVTCTLSLS